MTYSEKAVACIRSKQKLFVKIYSLPSVPSIFLLADFPPAAIPPQVFLTSVLLPSALSSLGPRFSQPALPSALYLPQHLSFIPPSLQPFLTSYLLSFGSFFIEPFLSPVGPIFTQSILSLGLSSLGLSCHQSLHTSIQFSSLSLSFTPTFISLSQISRQLFLHPVLSLISPVFAQSFLPSTPP